MSSGQNTKIRLVRCPKCRQLLAELAYVPVYECGGCGTILQAKVRRNDVGDSKTDLPQTDLAHSSQLEQDKKFSSSSENLIPPTEECSLIQKNGSYQNGSGGRTREPEDINFSDDVPSSAELIHHSSDPSSPIRNATGKLPEDTNYPNEVPSSAELTQYLSDPLSPVMDASRELPENINFPDEFPSSADLTHHSSDSSSPVMDSSGELPENINFPDEFPSSAELTHHSSDPSSPVMDASCKVDGTDASASKTRSRSCDNKQIERTNTSINNADTSAVDSDSSRLSMHQTAEQLQHSQKSIPCGFNRVEPTFTIETAEVADSCKSIPCGLDSVQSTDSMETAELIDPSFELNGALRDLSKSPTTRSAYAYDGSISSDGTEEQFPGQHKRTFRDADFIGNEDRAEFPVNRVMGRFSEVEQESLNFLSSVDKHYAMKGSAWGSKEPLEAMRYQIGNRMGVEVDKNPSRMPLNMMGYQARYEYGGPSSHWRDDIRSSSGSHLVDKLEHPEQERIKLLRMVYDLQDQLQRTNINKGRSDSRDPSRGSWSGNQIFSFKNHEAAKEEIHYDLRRLLNERSQGKNWPPQSTFSQIPFLGEGTNSGLQVDHPCMHYDAPERRCSMQLPYPVCCCKTGLCRVHLHPGEIFYNPYSSVPSISQQFIESKFPLNFCDVKSNDQRHVEHKIVKRHFRPIASAAPFVTCYRCLQLLQLPADFLLFRKRFHKLRCGACSEILRFSLKSDTHILPYSWCAEDIASNELDSSSDAFYRRNYASNDFCAHADPVSCSDDYGRSFCRSCSTEGEQLHPLQGDAHNRKMSSRSSFVNSGNRKEVVLKQSLAETNSLSGPSSNTLTGEKFSSEIEEKRPTTGSPLHRLMGYSSISQVIRGSGKGASSSLSRENPELK